MPTKVIINGAKGRMGRALVQAAGAHREIEVLAGIDVGDSLASVVDQARVVIDFSFHSVTRSVLEICSKAGCAVVLGTTGHDKSEQDFIHACSAKIPIVWASNFSTGVNTLFWLTRKAAEILGPGFDIEVVEMHHRLKKDAPSGTAMSLAKVLTEVRKQTLDDALRHGRHGITGERTGTEIGMHSLRGGDVIGDHTVIFSNDGERVELTHKASSRDTFAHGALRAAAWVAGKPAGLFDMGDVLGLKDSR